MDENKILAAILAATMFNDEQKEKTTVDIRKKSEDLGNTMYQSYLGFKDAGFTDEQAFQIVLKIGGRK